MPDDAPARRQPPEVRRQQILDAAQRTLLQRGLQATTVADVADEAGVAKGTVYLYFESKSELLAALRARYLDEVVLAADPTPEAPASRRLRDLVVGLFDAGTAQRALHQLLFHEAGFSEDDAFAALRSHVRMVIEDGVRAGELAVDDVDVAASFLLDGVHGVLIEALRGSSRASGYDRAVQVAALVNRALAPPA